MASGQAMEPTAQDEAIAFLSDPDHYPENVDRVVRIDTHAAVIFLVGNRAYKMKRQVRFSFLDFTTLPQRERAIRAELALNRPNAPEIYLEVAALRRQPDGGLAFDAEGPVVEWLLVMRRFDETQTLDYVSEREGLSPALLDGLSDAVFAYHGEAPVLAQPFGGAEAIERLIEENDTDLTAWPALFPPEATATLKSETLRWLERLRSLLDRRRAMGRVRRCHGDLHLGNIVLWHGRPLLFDCIEFSEEIAGIDIFYDLAFLLMDLVHRGLVAEANQVLNRYLLFADDYEGLATLPLFLSLRATVRAKVSAPAAAAQTDLAMARHLREEASTYFAQARNYLAPAPARLVALGGLSGTGKSTLAARLAPCLGSAPGAVWLRSDSLRKVLLGKPLDAPLGKESYAADVTERVYSELCARAERSLTAGRGVLIDAVHGRPAERDALEALAARLGVPFQGLWLDAPLDVRTERVGARRGDASDADAAVVAQQESYDLGEIGWARLDAGQPLARLEEQARNLL